jgi:hypothetical protein
MIEESRIVDAMQNSLLSLECLERVFLVMGLWNLEYDFIRRNSEIPSIRPYTRL